MPTGPWFSFVADPLASYLGIQYVPILQPASYLGKIRRTIEVQIRLEVAACM